MKIKVWMIVAACCIFFTGCSLNNNDKERVIIRGMEPEYSDDLINIGFIQTGKESDWRDANTDDYINTFTLEKGYNLIYIDGNSSPERQVHAMYDLISQNVDYIILQPIIETGWEEVLQEAKSKGIPVIIADRQVAASNDLYETWVGSDFYQEGIKAMDWLISYLKKTKRDKEELNIVLLRGTEGATAAIGRTEGIMSVVEKHDNWNVIFNESGNFTEGEGQQVMEALLADVGPEHIDIIISENDNMAFGAMMALDNYGAKYGPKGDIIIISFDGLHEAFEKMIEGKLHASIECNPLLGKSVEEVIKELEAGNTVDKQYFTDEGVYTYENAAKYIDERVY